MDTVPALPVPPLGAEVHTWPPRGTGTFSRRELQRQTGTYESAVVAPIADWQPQLPPAVAADVEEATAALAAFDQYAAGRLSGTDRVLGPMSAVLLRTESASSSQIEQITTGARQLALAEIDADARPNAQTVVGNIRAMQAALRLADRLDEAAVLDMHRELLSRQPGMEPYAGTYRHELVWIGPGDAGSLTADYVAPQPATIPAAMRDLLVFIGRQDLPVLLQTAVAHAQFETIHPFADGNGRTGRALVQAILRNKRVLTATTAPVSAGLLRNTERYFSALGTYRAGDAAPLVACFCDAARFAATSGRELIAQLTAQLDEYRRRLAGTRRDAAAWELLPHLIAQPVVNLRHLRAEFGWTEPRALRALTLLGNAGILTEQTGARRNRVWSADDILGILDAYAAGLRRT